MKDTVESIIRRNVWQIVASYCPGAVGTEFEVEEAREIVFKNIIPILRPADAHDVLDTFRLVSGQQEMTTVPKTTAKWAGIAPLGPVKAVEMAIMLR